MSSELQAGEDYVIEHRDKLAEELLSWRKTGKTCPEWAVIALRKAISLRSQ